MQLIPVIEKLHFQYLYSCLQCHDDMLINKLLLLLLLMLKTFVLLSIFEETVILFSGFIDDGFIKQWQNVDFGDPF